MNKKSFRSLLFIFLGFVIIDFFATLLSRPCIPNSVIQTEQLAITESPFLNLFIILGGGAFILESVALIGLFFLWRPARYIFCVSLVIRILTIPFLSQWACSTNWQQFFSSIELLIEGMILVIVFTCCNESLFSRKRSKA